MTTPLPRLMRQLIDSDSRSNKGKRFMNMQIERRLSALEASTSQSDTPTVIFVVGLGSNQEPTTASISRPDSGPIERLRGESVDAFKTRVAAMARSRLTDAEHCALVFLTNPKDTA